MTTHTLKTWPAFFRAVKTNEKTADVRKDDRHFAVGDVLELREYCPETETEAFTGECCLRYVTHIVAGGQLGIEPGYVVMSLSEEPYEDPRIAQWTPGNQGW